MSTDATIGAQPLLFDSLPETESSVRRKPRRARTAPETVAVERVSEPAPKPGDRDGVMGTPGMVDPDEVAAARVEEHELVHARQPRGEPADHRHVELLPVVRHQEIVTDEGACVTFCSCLDAPYTESTRNSMSCSRLRSARF